MHARLCTAASVYVYVKRSSLSTVQTVYGAASGPHPFESKYAGSSHTRLEWRDQLSDLCLLDNLKGPRRTAVPELVQTAYSDDGDPGYPLELVTSVFPRLSEVDLGDMIKIYRCAQRYAMLRKLDEHVDRVNDEMLTVCELLAFDRERAG